MDATIAQKFDRAVRLLKEASSLLEQIRPIVESQPDSPRSSSGKDLDKKLRMLLHSDKWPIAVDPRRIGDTNSDADKMARAAAIIDQVVDVPVLGKRLLDFGCGEGHAAFTSIDRGVELAVGYDLIGQGWGQFPSMANLVLTTELSVADEYAPYDVILMNDVLDHCLDPAEALREARELLAEDGRLCVRCHPFCSRHGGHNYHTLNRAYAQLFFPEGEGPRVLRPFQEYRDWFEEAGLNVVYERPEYGEVPKFFQMSPYLSDKLKELYGQSEFPEAELGIDSITYSLSK